MTERRKYRRLDANFIANVRTGRAEEGTDEDASRVTNISQGGVFIATKYPFPHGAYVEFDFALPGRNQAVHIKGKVCWSNPHGDDPGMGIEFLEVSTISKEAISSYVGERILEEYVKPLTQSEIHRNMLRLYIRKIGDSFTTYALGGFLSVDVDDLSKVLKHFEAQGLVAFTKDKVSFLPPPDEQSEAAIQNWIAQNPAEHGTS